MKKTVMFFGAHADDMEILAAGTMRKFVVEGYDAFSVMMTNNLCGARIPEGGDSYFTTGPEETSAIRHREARAAADLLGVQLIFLDFKECSYFNGERRVYAGTPDYDESILPGREILLNAPCIPHCVEDVAKVIERHQPEIVITHHPGGAFEHIAAAHLAAKAWQRAASNVPLGELWYSARVGSPRDLFSLAPDVLVDITPYHDLKDQAVRLHASQRLSIERINEVDACWGRVAGVAWAEPFHALRRHL